MNETPLQRGRKAPRFAIANLPKLMDDFEVSLEDTVVQLSKDEFDKAYKGAKQGPNESLPEMLKRLATRVQPGRKGTIGEFRKSGDVTEIDLSMGDFTKSAAGFFKRLAKERALNKSEIGHLWGEVTPAAEVPAAK